MSENQSLALSKLNVFSNDLLNKIVRFAEVQNLVLTDATKQRLSSGSREAFMVLAEKNLSPYDLDIENLMDIAQQVAFLPLNPNAKPKQTYFSIRKIGGKPKLFYDIQGDGWETLLRLYGEDVIKTQCFIIREGDYYGGIEYSGLDIVPPKMKFATNEKLIEKGLNKRIRKVTDVVYAIQTSNGEIWHSVPREDIKANIISQARNNGAEETLLREMALCSIDEILDPKGKWLDMTIKNKYNETKNLLSPTYRSQEVVESMLITKAKKHICMRYPKDFDKDPENRNKGNILKNIYQKTLDEDDYENEETNLQEVDVVMEDEKSNFKTNSGKEKINKPKEKKEKLEVVQEIVVEEDVSNTENIDDENIVDQNEVEEIEEENVEHSQQKPSWF